ncbi:hypothetical protein BMS3Bbin04_00241 [bacterium BMS3Bbin04]|nr:hypothetical protein BMS3Bbin04_00241 [bacterium BMS3Bbin04]
MGRVQFYSAFVGCHSLLQRTSFGQGASVISPGGWHVRRSFDTSSIGLDRRLHETRVYQKFTEGAVGGVEIRCDGEGSLHGSYSV